MSRTLLSLQANKQGAVVDEIVQQFVRIVDSGRRFDKQTAAVRKGPGAKGCKNGLRTARDVDGGAEQSGDNFILPGMNAVVSKNHLHVGCPAPVGKSLAGVEMANAFKGDARPQYAPVTLTRAGQNESLREQRHQSGGQAAEIRLYWVIPLYTGSK